MRIAIIGTRGIPNHHGGFEQFAEFFAVYASDHGHDVAVYNSHSHPYKNKDFNGVQIIHCYDPEEKIGTVGQFFYDLNCILDARKRKYDVILQLGYTSSSIWSWLLPKKAIVVTNMDGLEWKRTKYNKYVQKFLLKAERWAAKYSDFLVSDSVGIQEYIKDTYNLGSEFIAYGADVVHPNNPAIIKEKGIMPGEYYCLIARMEPENNVEIILDGYAASTSRRPFYVVGNYKSTKFGQYLKDKFNSNNNIFFLGAIYDLNFLNHLRHYSSLYFHGHSVGGTNPSLLEAMASGALIVANNNIFNKAILRQDAFYFNTSVEVEIIINTVKNDEHKNKVLNNVEKIEKQYNWEIINKKYLTFLTSCYNENKENKS